MRSTASDRAAMAILRREGTDDLAFGAVRGRMDLAPHLPVPRDPSPDERHRPVHRPSAATIAASQMTAFTRALEAETGRRFLDYSALHAFSVSEYRRFWKAVLRWSGLVHGGAEEPVCEG